MNRCKGAYTSVLLKKERYIKIVAEERAEGLVRNTLFLKAQKGNLIMVYN